MTDRVSGRIANHPTVRKVLARKSTPPPVEIDADWLRETCLAAGDDVAFASIENPDLESEHEHVESALPGTKAHTEKRYPHKPVKVVDSGIAGRS